MVKSGTQLLLSGIQNRRQHQEEYPRLVQATLKCRFLGSWELRFGADFFEMMASNCYGTKEVCLPSFIKAQ